MKLINIGWYKLYKAFDFLPSITLWRDKCPDGSTWVLSFSWLVYGIEIEWFKEKR